MTIPDSERLAALVDLARSRVAAIRQIELDVRAGDDDETDAAEAFAQRARAGDLGRNWQILQARIDLGETSVTAVMDGTDDSVEAQAVRENSRENLDRLLEDEKEQAERDGRPDPVRELTRDRERLLARGEALRARMAALAEGEK
jgi:hypothetical protein